MRTGSWRRRQASGGRSAGDLRGRGTTRCRGTWRGTRCTGFGAWWSGRRRATRTCVRRVWSTTSRQTTDGQGCAETRSQPRRTPSASLGASGGSAESVRGLSGDRSRQELHGQLGSHAAVLTSAPRTVTAVTTWREFRIADPGYRSRRDSLTRYDPERPVWVRGSVERTAASSQLRLDPSAVGVLEEAVGDTLAPTVSTGGGTGILTDGLGRRVGRIDSAAPTLAEIPGAGFDPYLEQGELTDTIGGNGLPARTSVAISVLNEGGNAFTLAVQATQSGPMSLTLRDRAALHGGLQVDVKAPSAGACGS